MQSELTDAEVICTWMEPCRKREATVWDALNQIGVWWRSCAVGDNLMPVGHRPAIYEWRPRILTLDALREVQERLTDRQWSDYIARIFEAVDKQGAVVGGRWRRFLHATAEQKIRALASVLRSLTEPTDAPAGSQREKS